ncbi:MAG TPA: DinB family protein [Terracidiphilus sp.]
MSDHASISALRKQLAETLRSSHAHADFAQSVKDFPAPLRGKRPEGSPHSPWELLEHMRIAQWDILEFSRKGEHESPKWPEGYWPKSPEPPDEKAWDRSVHQYQQDTDAFCKLIEDESNDLFAKIPHGDGQTLLREALLAADHNAYHLGQLVLARRLLGAWKG